MLFKVFLGIYRALTTKPDTAPWNGVENDLFFFDSVEDRILTDIF